MIKKLSIIIFFIVFASRPANAQLKDTIIYSIQQKPKYFATLASFNTFIDHNYANIFRIKTGLSYNQRIRFGIGYSNLANNAVTTDSIHLVGDNYNYYTKGILNFFTGVGPRLMHKIPANGLFFLCYEAFKTFLQVEDATK